MFQWICVVLLLCMVACGQITSEPKDSSSDSATTETQADDDEAIECTDFTFSTLPIAIEHIRSIIPLGTHDANKGGVPIDHLFLILKDKAVKAPVYAVTDAVLYNFDFTYKPDGSHDGGINLAICGGTATEPTVTVSHGHITTFSASLQSLLNNEASCTNSNGTIHCRWEGQHSLKGGDLLGYAGGPQATTAAALDFGMIDGRITPLNLIGPASFYKGQEHAVCPLDYFSVENKAAFEAKLKLESFYAPLCGSADLGIKGTLQGPWFHKDADLNKASQNVTPIVGFFPEMRSSTRLVMNRFTSASDNSIRYFDFMTTGLVRRNFSDVTADGNIYCYDTFFSHPLTDNTLGGYVFVQMTTAKTIQYEEISSGTCPSDPNTLTFSNKVVHYLRP
jgi:hypothetical protein